MVIDLSYSLNSLNGAIQGITTGFIQGDTRSLDYSSHRVVYGEI